MQKLSKEQKDTLERLGFGNQHLWGAGFLFIAFMIIVINMVCRVVDSHKYDEYEYTVGTVVKFTSYKTPRTGVRRSSYDYYYSIEAEYYVDGYDKAFKISDSGDAYMFFRKGKELRIYYEADAPGRAFITKKDFLTGLYLPAEKQYYQPLYFSLFPTIIGIYLIVDYMKARKRALQNKLFPSKKVKSSKDPDYDPYLHDLARMPGYKRGWLPFQICGTVFYLFTVFGGIMTIRSVIMKPTGDIVSPIIFVSFLMLLGHGMLAGVIYSIYYLNGKKKAFITGFMADEATAVYVNRDEAAEILWKLVKRYMESEPFFSRFKLEYNRDWLETYEDRLEHLKAKAPSEEQTLEGRIWHLGFLVKTVNDGRNKPYLEVSCSRIPDEKMVADLLYLLTYEKVVRFFDPSYTSGSDPGRYVEVYMMEKRAVYSYGNHGWSSDYKCTTAEDVAKLIVKTWNNSVLIKDNPYAGRDWDLYYRSLRNVKPI